MPRKKKFPVTQVFKARGWTAQSIDALLQVPAQEVKGSLCTNDDRKECSKAYKCEIANTKSGALVAFTRCRKLKLMIERTVDVKEFSG